MVAYTATAALSAKPRQYSVEDALLLAAMMYIDDYRTGRKPARHSGQPSIVPPVSREGLGMGGRCPGRIRL